MNGGKMEAKNTKTKRYYKRLLFSNFEIGTFLNYTYLCRLKNNRYATFRTRNHQKRKIEQVEST